MSPKWEPLTTCRNARQLLHRHILKGRRRLQCRPVQWPTLNISSCVLNVAAKIDKIDSFGIQYRPGARSRLILEDWGLEPLDGAARHDLLEILEERYGRRSTIITSQIPIDKWHELIGDPTYADAIIDRLVHNAHRNNPTGPCLRRRPANRSS